MMTTQPTTVPSFTLQQALAYWKIAKDSLAIVCQHAQGFYQQGWLMGTSGNLSYKVATAADGNEPLSFYVTASGLDKGNLTPADFLWVTSNATACLAEETRQPSAECLLHEAIYTHVPSATVVYHIHSPLWTFLSAQLPSQTLPRGLELPAIEMLKGLGASSHEEQSSVLVLPNSQAMPELVALLANQWDALNVPGFVLQGHGLYTWGCSPFEAKRHVEIFEFLANQLFLRKTLLYTTL
jgi:methylthioribulose-1-phosphate dehydratase